MLYTCSLFLMFFVTNQITCAAAASNLEGSPQDLTFTITRVLLGMKCVVKVDPINYVWEPQLEHRKASFLGKNSQGESLEFEINATRDEATLSLDTRARTGSIQGMICLAEPEKIFNYLTIDQEPHVFTCEGRQKTRVVTSPNPGQIKKEERSFDSFLADLFAKKVVLIPLKEKEQRDFVFDGPQAGTEDLGQYLAESKKDRAKNHYPKNTKLTELYLAAEKDLADPCSYPALKKEKRVRNRFKESMKCIVEYVRLMERFSLLHKQELIESRKD